MNAAKTCWVEYDYCFRINANGEPEIIIQKEIIKQTGPRSMFWGSFPCIMTYSSKKQMSLDKLIGAIVNNQNVFEFEDNAQPFCPSYSNTAFRVYAASCQTEPFWDFSEYNPTDNTNGSFIRVPCSLVGFCKYEYKYCKYVENGVFKLRQSRTLVTGGGQQCPGTFVYDPTLVTYNCYPVDCYPTILNKPVPHQDDIDNPGLDDSNFYIIN